MSPTQRTLAECRRRGWLAAVTERWNPYAKIRQDLFGFVDVLAVREPNMILAIQTTTMNNRAARRDKILASPMAARWLRSGGEISIWAWAKHKVKRGGTAFRWELEEQVISVEEITKAAGATA